MKLRSLAVFTAMRSEYGPLKPLIEAVHRDPDFELRLLVGGGHFVPSLGNTVNEIKEDGFPIYRTFPFLKEGASHGDNFSLFFKDIYEYFVSDQPDLVIVLGDRIELLPLANAALLAGVPLAHLSGGESTEGALDNQVRHALTKLSNLHFPATETYGKNLRSMGEEAWRICVSGEPGLDPITSMNFIPKDELYKSLNIPGSKRLISTSFHPDTIGGRVDSGYLRELFETLTENKDWFFLCTASNPDPGGEAINTSLQDLAKTRPESMRFVPSLGKTRYYSVLRHADLVLGNSSSGIVEAQSFEVPVVNVGTRQQGRLANPNVLHTREGVDDIIQAMERALSTDFQQVFFGKPNIYGDGKSCARILTFLKAVNKTQLLQKKDVFP